MNGPEAGSPPIKVLVVDDHGVVRRGMRAFLSALHDMEITGEAASVRAAMNQLQEGAVFGGLPDVVLMDLVLPEMDGVAGIKAIKAAHPQVEVVAMTSFSEPERVHAALAAGAAGYLLKDAEADEVATAIRAAAAGEIHLDAAVARRLTRTLADEGGGRMSLSAREREVLRLVGRGFSNRDIATKLGISERTARSHVSNILVKLGVASRTQAALWAIREGLAPSP